MGMGYAFTRADISFDPVLQIEDGTMDMHTVALSYVRTMELFERSSRLECMIPFQDARWKGRLAGEPASAHRSGMADPVVRVAMNLLGAPPLKGKDFAVYRASRNVETSVGLALAVHLRWVRTRKTSC